MIRFLLLTAIAAPVVGGGQVARIRVLLLDAKSDKPINKVSVTMFLWNGTWDIKKGLPVDYHAFDGKTNAEGIVVFDLPQSPPEHMAFQSVDIWGCSTLSFSTSEAIKSGVVAPYKHDAPQCYHGVLKGDRAPVPGEVIIFDQKITAWQRMLREIP